MGNIVLLDDLTINKIAAGEVIERPLNVVKEVVENSIDAGATKIIVEIKKGGKQLIKVIDNGKGIPKDDMDIALERHATSKLRKIEDLEKIYTMGFRGEALASIVSVAKLTMISRTSNDDFGTKLVAEAGDILEREETGAQLGTTIMVENLFFNVPVRYKFLKQDATEFKYIKDWIQKAALSIPSISFKLINEGKVCFQSNGNGKIEDVIYSIYGKEIKENLVKVNFEEDDVKVTGVIGNTMVARDSRKDQILFLNKRNIKNQVLINSADQAFKGSTGIGKYGFFILNLEMPANFYDINAHPTKMEVRFEDESKIYKIFYHAIKNAILSKDFLGNTQNDENNDEYISNEFDFLTNHFGQEDEENLDKSVKEKNDINMKEEQDVQTDLSNIENDKREESISKSENYFARRTINANESVNLLEQKNELIHRENKREVNYKYIGILFRTFIIVEIEDELYLIDQHAAHERLLYEQIKENYKNHISSNSQMILMPEVYNLTNKEFEFVQKNLNLFQSYGFDVEMFGNNAVKINGIPDIEYRAKSKNIFLEVLDEMITNERASLKDVEERFVATVACKAAVKANMDLVPQEVEYLIQNLLTLKNPYTCPHGRPTTIKISKEELLKRADLISLHCPLIMGDNGTYHLINDETIALMKDTVMLVNTSRGPIIDPEALIRALKQGKFHAVALDVYEGEDNNVYTDKSDVAITNDITARLQMFPQLVLTSHQAFFTREALQAIAVVTMENARNFNEGNELGSAECKA